jgi:uncharacterized heparinase superfamily protein
MKYQHTKKICSHAGHTQMKIIMQDLLMKYQHTRKVCSHAENNYTRLR